MDIAVGDVRTVVGGITLSSGTTTVLLGPINLARYGHKSFHVYNLGPVTLSGCVVQTNPDHQGSESGVESYDGKALAGPNAGLWEHYDTTTFQSLAAGAVKSLQISSNTYRWWRLAAVNSDTPDITASGWCYARTI